MNIYEHEHLSKISQNIAKSVQKEGSEWLRQRPLNCCHRFQLFDLSGDWPLASAWAFLEVPASPAAELRFGPESPRPSLCSRQRYLPKSLERVMPPCHAMACHVVPCRARRHHESSTLTAIAKRRDEKVICDSL